MNTEVWVLTWSYGDGSASGVVRVYTDELRANEDYALVQDAYGKDYKLLSAPLYCSGDQPS